MKKEEMQMQISKRIEKQHPQTGVISSKEVIVIGKTLKETEKSFNKIWSKKDEM